MRSNLLLKGIFMNLLRHIESNDSAKSISYAEHYYKELLKWLQHLNHKKRPTSNELIIA